MNIIDIISCPADYDCRDCKNFDLNEQAIRFTCKFGLKRYYFDLAYQPTKKSLENPYRIINYHLPLMCDKYEIN